MARLWLVGGKERQAAVLGLEEWQGSERALLVELDTATGAVSERLSWVSPPDRCPDHTPSFIFKAPSWDGEQLLLCTQTEVLRADRQLRVLEQISHPWFNDVHHVTRVGRRLLVASTGLDAVVELGEPPRIHSVTGEDPWARFDAAKDWRKVPTTKPHRSHPNYIFELDGAPWVTRFEQRDAVELGGSGRIELGAGEGVHDGNADGDDLWFTRVDGRLLRVDGRRRRVVEDIDLLAYTGARVGWCRGICVSKDWIYVGFSRPRQTSLRRNVAWLSRAVSQKPQVVSAARVVAVNRRSRRVEAFWDMPSDGLSLLFGILEIA